MNYKRSNDPNSIARRASLHEQKPQSGFFGSMWHKYVPVYLVCLSYLHHYSFSLLAFNYPFIIPTFHVRSTTIA
ncbi:hypothetical protein F5Y14DRAFT_400783 [Nemania sp. NC0429]|nr:hypothetical protein F5Y14DRAFT_400783 [Nemania sp. NC0429]